MQERHPLTGLYAPSTQRPLDPHRIQIDEFLAPSPLTEQEWEYAENKFRRRLQQGDYPWVANEIEQMRDAIGRSDTRTRLRLQDPTLPARYRALALFVAAQARQRADVMEFRRDVLKGKLLTIAEVPEWLAARRRKDGSNCIVESIVDSGRVSIGAASKIVIEPPLSEVDRVRYERLQYFGPAPAQGGQFYYVRNMPCAPGGVLWTLRELSQRLSDEYTWHPATGTMFVCTDLPGMTPDLPESITGRVTKHKIPALNRITLDVHPSINAKTLRGRYGALRAEHFGRRNRAMTDKHVQLAIFYTENAGMPYKQMMAAWNKQFPDWRYSTLQNFTTRVNEACRRIGEGPLQVK